MNCVALRQRNLFKSLVAHNSVDCFHVILWKSLERGAWNGVWHLLIMSHTATAEKHFSSNRVAFHQQKNDFTLRGGRQQQSEKLKNLLKQH